MNPIDELVHITARIETSGPQGVGSGTGFFMLLADPSTGNPSYGLKIGALLDNFSGRWIGHPDPAIDLAVMPIASILEEAKGQGEPIYFKSLPIETIARPEHLNDLSAIEEVIMIGYPNGLWDSHNNLPMVRRGITATPAFVDFEGKPEFLIDCAVFPGSSGSPVLLFDKGPYVDKTGNMHMGGVRMRFLGVLWGGPQSVATGEVCPGPIPTVANSISVTPILINLGYCVKAHQLLWFEDHFRQVTGRAQT